jgi:hypothetical protein
MGLYHLSLGIKDFGEPAPTVKLLGKNETALGFMDKIPTCERKISGEKPGFLASFFAFLCISVILT